MNTRAGIRMFLQQIICINTHLHTYTYLCVSTQTHMYRHAYFYILKNTYKYSSAYFTSVNTHNKNMRRQKSNTLMLGYHTFYHLINKLLDCYARHGLNNGPFYEGTV